MQEPEPKISLGDIDTAPVTFGAPQTESPEQNYPALWSKFTQVSEEKIQLQAEVESLRRINATNEILNDLIKPYALRTFVFMCSYCGFVALVLVIGLCGHLLPTSVLQILVGSTAVTVIGLVGMVLSGIFVGARQRL
ncbi:hypothetical protein [Acidocella sp.]|uniref:hypothetical protein n=1 Tax=Acidocella sp. TaxID=50710 RepID=UPI0017FE19CE|nr:hypothetical protein [Acidocella sp.]NNM57126.1 hypothetical protein [Acidocella sp.]